MIARQALICAAAFVVLSAIPAIASALPAPRVTSVQSLDQLAVPDRPYDESANADAAVDAAFARASAEHKLVLIDLGGNWCADCRILAGVMDLPEVRSFIDAHYVSVSVDVGRFNRNLQIPARFGITSRLEAVPALLISTPEGKLLDREKVSALGDARSMSAQAMADWLAQWVQ